MDQAGYQHLVSSTRAQVGNRQTRLMSFRRTKVTANLGWQRRALPKVEKGETP